MKFHYCMTFVGFSTFTIKLGNPIVYSIASSLLISILHCKALLYYKQWKMRHRNAQSNLRKSKQRRWLRRLQNRFKILKRYSLQRKKQSAGNSQIKLAIEGFQPIRKHSNRKISNKIKALSTIDADGCLTDLSSNESD